MMGKAETQGKLWSKMPQDWTTIQEPMHRPLWEAMLDSASVGSGTRILDVGCGGGGASALAAQRGARVTGLDAAEGLLALARQRTPQGDFHLGDIENLPFDDEVFDTVFAANSLQYSENRIASLRELARVCRRQGRIVAGLFASPEKVKFSAVFEAMRNALPEPPAGDGPFELSAPGKLEELFDEAGLKRIGSSEVDCPFTFPDFDTFWRACVSSGPAQGILHNASEEALKSALSDAVERFRADSGMYRIQPNFFKYVAATR